MDRQAVAVVELSNAERVVVNAQKRVPKRFWTHKVCCGEFETFLTIGAREDLAHQVVANWPDVFSEVATTPHPNARPVEEANRRFLITLEERFGAPHERKLKGLEAKTFGRSNSKRSLLARLFGR